MKLDWGIISLLFLFLFGMLAQDSQATTWTSGAIGACTQGLGYSCNVTSSSTISSATNYTFDNLKVTAGVTITVNAPVWFNISTILPDGYINVSGTINGNGGAGGNPTAGTGGSAGGAGGAAAKNGSNGNSDINEIWEGVLGANATGGKYNTANGYGTGGGAGSGGAGGNVAIILLAHMVVVAAEASTGVEEEVLGPQVMLVEEAEVPAIQSNSLLITSTCFLEVQ